MTKQQLDALFTKLEQDYPNSDTLLSVENMVDWLTKYQRESQAALDNEFMGVAFGPPVFAARLRPSSLPKWECVGDSTPRRYCTAGLDRAPTEVYKATAEQVINQSRSYPSNPVAPATLSRTQIANLMRSEWVHQHDDLITAYVPADNGGGVAAFSVGRVFLGRLNIFRVEQGTEAEVFAWDYLFKLVSPDDHTCNWVQEGSKVYCTICEGK